MRMIGHGLDNLEVVAESSRVMLTYADSGNIVLLSPKYADIGQARANAEEIAMRCRYHDRLVEALESAMEMLINGDDDLQDSEAVGIESLLAELSAHNGGEG